METCFCTWIARCCFDLYTFRSKENCQRLREEGATSLLEEMWLEKLLIVVKAEITYNVVFYIHNIVLRMISMDTHPRKPSIGKVQPCNLLEDYLVKWNHPASSHSIIFEQIAFCWNVFIRIHLLDAKHYERIDLYISPYYGMFQTAVKIRGINSFRIKCHMHYLQLSGKTAT